MDLDIFREGEQFHFLGSFDDPSFDMDLDLSTNEDNFASYITTDFDLLKLFKDEPPPSTFKAATKKIDMQAQKYITAEDEEEVDVETLSECEDSSTPVIRVQVQDLNALLEQFEVATEQNTPEPVKQKINTSKHKRIMDTLPQELITRIKESGKRKPPIPVIPPLPPNKKRKKKFGRDLIKAVINLDHDYCTTKLSVFNQKKDSGFESEEESIVNKQRIVKINDGRSNNMVSLLKVNAIQNVEIEKSKKRKLNLEEYKKRHMGSIECRKENHRQTLRSPKRGSTQEEEDQETRMRRHREKLERMAIEVLRAQKKVKKEENVSSTIERSTNAPITARNNNEIRAVTLLSVGCQTEMSTERFEQLTQLAPILELASDKIKSSSLINSLIQNTVRKEKDGENVSSSVEGEEHHGEDKTIVYLNMEEKLRKCHLVTTGVQTDVALIEQMKGRYRRRSLSLSCGECSDEEVSSTRSRYDKWCSGDESKSSSRSSSSSSSATSISLSETTSDYSSKSNRQKEYFKEVEERRVVYVGGLASNVTKEALRRRFQKFGTITNTSLHSRDKSGGDKYGFVTFANKLDAYEAIEHGNDDATLPRYDLSFGGRRIFCKTTYVDLDNIQDGSYSTGGPRPGEESFDVLLRQVQEKLLKRKA